MKRGKKNVDFVVWVGGGLLILLAILFVVIYGKEEFTNTDTEMHEIAKKVNEKALKDIQTQVKSSQEIMTNIIKKFFPQTKIPQKNKAAVKVKGGGTNGVRTVLGG